MRLGIFGGTFDPVHYGHLLLAESAREACRLDAVWFLPTATPPHKPGRTPAPAVARAEMLELALAGHGSFQVARHEIERGGMNYTVDTLSAIRAERPSDELFFLLGADALADLPTWRQPARICQLAQLVPVRRAGQGPIDYDALAALLPAETLDAIRRHEAPMPAIGLSASDLRDRVRTGRSIRFRTPRAVEQYVLEHGLYHDDA